MKKTAGNEVKNSKNDLNNFSILNKKFRISSKNWKNTIKAKHRLKAKRKNRSKSKSNQALNKIHNDVLNSFEKKVNNDHNLDFSD